MDWNGAIEKNREALKRILAALLIMVGQGNRPAATDGRQSESELAQAADRPTDCPLPTADCRPTVPRHLHRAVLQLLRPAEAATRRLIIVMARDIPAPPMRRQASTTTARKRTTMPPIRPCAPPDEAGKPPALPLFDRLPTLRGPAQPRAAGVPRISFPGLSVPFPVSPRRPPRHDDPIDTARLALRLQTLAAALDDLPSHARRFARWRATRDAEGTRIRQRDAEGTRTRQRDAAGTQGKQPASAGLRNRLGKNPSRRRGVTRRIWPLRPGRPPGWRRRPFHEVHHVLDVAHDLALWAMEPTNTS